MTVFQRSRRFAKGGLMALALAALVPVVAHARPEPGARSRGFRLFARSLGALTINRVYLGLSSAKGNIGVDSTNSSTIGGGFWPRGTPNQFVFNSGLQVAGKINWPGGAWDGNVAGAFFFDPKGTTEHGDEIQPIYNATNPEDLASWPDAAIVRENGTDQIYDPVLLGLQSASQGDVWFMTWDGNPTLLGGRDHPLGIVVESRGLGWNFPTGNEDITYFIFNFYNVTSLNPADYAGARPEIRPILLEAAQNFQTRSEAQFGISIPDGGYAMDSLFAAFAADMDVTGNAGANYCSVNLPFALGYCYEHTFLASGNEFYGDPTIWGAPFFAGPGFVGVKYLKSPTGAGEIQLFSNTINSATGFRDPQTIAQLFRYLSGTVSTAAGDQACQFNPIVDRICFINPTFADSRFYQSSTALSLLPGGTGTIVVAYIFAAPVAIPGFTPTSGTDVTPGNPLRLVNSGQLALGANRIDSLTGFRGFSDANGDQEVTQDEFVTVPGSLLNKALTAQVVFDNGFLLPFAPNSPNFYLIPGDNSVTIAWQPSSSEVGGDPYFAVAGDPGTSSQPNPLYDPNYRQFDVEGYRIYRGRVDAGSQLTLVAQFDYGGTFFTDYTGQINPSSECGPEFGITASCPAPFNYTQGSGVAPSVSVDYALVGEVVQIKLGTTSRVETAAGDLLIIANSDTLLTGAAAGAYPGLVDNGVPFSFEDRSVRNNFRYFYSVTAFDVNSFQSGPASLESARTTKAVTPVSASSNIGDMPALSFEVTDASGQAFTQTSFSIDPATGRFNGPPPPLGAASVLNVAFQGAQTLWPALAVGDLAATIDSVKVRGDHEPYPDEGIGSFDCQGLSNGQGLCAEYFLTYRQPGKPDVRTRSVIYQPILTAVFGDDPAVTTSTNGAAVPFDDAQLARFGVPGGVGSLQANADLEVGQYSSWTSAEFIYARRVYGPSVPGGSNANGPSPGGARWFTGANETVDHPSYSFRVGNLPGVDTIFAPLSDIWPPNPALPITGGTELPFGVCMQVYLYGVGTFGRSADIEVVWGTGGAVTVTDLTHRVPVPFGPTPGVNYGFMVDGNGNGRIDWTDIAWLEEMVQVHNHIGFCATGTTGASPSIQSPSVAANGILPEPGDGLHMTETATATPVSTTAPANGAVAANFLQTGSGFGMYIAGHYFIFQTTGGQLPAPGTRWVLRTYAGDVRADNPGSSTPSNYTYTPKAGGPTVANLRINYVTGTKATDRTATSFDLTRVHTVPDPYFVTNGYEATTDAKILQFVNLPNQAIIRIYTSSGILVNVLEHRSTTFGGSLNWNLRNRNNQVVASGVYFYHIESGDARKVGRFTVVNFAQ